MLECHIIITGDRLYIVPIKGVECQTWRCDVSEFRFKMSFIYLEFDNISRFMEITDRFNVLKLLRY